MHTKLKKNVWDVRFKLNISHLSPHARYHSTCYTLKIDFFYPRTKDTPSSINPDLKINFFPGSKDHL